MEYQINSKLLKDLNFPEGSIATMVINKNSTIALHGNYKVKEGDHIFVFSIPSVLAEVEKAVQIRCLHEIQSCDGCSGYFTMASWIIDAHTPFCKYLLW